MSNIESVKIRCPYCGEKISIIIDCSIFSQSYIEDCQVCCRPIQLSINLGENKIPGVVVSREDE